MHPADVQDVSLLGIVMLPAKQDIIPFTNWSVLMRVNTNHIGVCLMIRKRVPMKKRVQMTGPYYWLEGALNAVVLFNEQLPEMLWRGHEEHEGLRQKEAQPKGRVPKSVKRLVRSASVNLLLQEMEVSQVTSVYYVQYI